MKISVLAVAAAMTVSFAGKSAADVGDAIVGGIIGGVIVNEANKNRQRKTVRRVYRAPVQTPARAEARQVQTALNYFGFPAGTPDGVLGQRSRGAISQYQAHLAYPVTGYLTEYEKSFLLSSYNRAQAGGPVTYQQIASNPQGTRGLLTMYRDEAAGVVTPPPAVVVAKPPPADEPEITFAAKEEPSGSLALPNFGGSGTDEASLASHCNTVSLLTNTNGGFTTLASMADQDAVLNEQFCLARTYAIAQGEALTASIQGVSTSQIAAQCEAFGPVMQEHLSALSSAKRDEVLGGVAAFAQSTGMNRDQLVTTSKICLSVGYRTDDLDVALGSAMLLTALGQQPYAELMGHHLSQGFGAANRPDLAKAWYAMAVEAVDNGQPAVFAPGQPERTQLIRAAALGEAGGAVVQPAATTLPTFKIEN